MSASATGLTGQAQRLWTLLWHSEARGIVPAVMSKAVMVILNFTMITLAARDLGTQEFGYYSILFSAASLCYIVAAAGQELFVIRAWNEHLAADDPAGLKRALSFTGMLSLGACVAVVALFLPWAQSSFGWPTALAAAAFLVAASMLQITMHLVRTAVSVAVGDGLGNGVLMLPAIVYLAACHITGAPATLAALFAALALGAALGLTVHLVILARLLAARYPHIWQLPMPPRPREWLGRSLRLWGANTIEATNQYLDVLVIGFLMSPTIAGAYFVTVRLANLFAAAADAVNLFATRHFSRLYHGGSSDDMNRLLDNVAWITLAFIGIGLAGISAGGYFALWVINPAYTDYFPELLLLCVGTATVAISRPCGSVLMLTGHEARYLVVIAISIALRLFLLFALIPWLGVMGAVVSSAVSMFAVTIVLRRETLSLTGLDVTIFRLFDHRRSEPTPRPAE